MISKLTPQQKKLLNVYADKWKSVAFSTESANRPQAEQGVHLAYELAELTPPQQIIWCDSPMAMMKHLFDKDLIGEPIKNFQDKQFREALWKPLQAVAWKPVHRLISQSFGSAHFEYDPHGISNVILEMIWATFPTIHKHKDWFYIGGQQSAYWLGLFDYYDEVLGYTEANDKLTGIAQVALNAGCWMPRKDICFISERQRFIKLDDDDKLHCEDGIAIGFADGWGGYAWHGEYVPEHIILHPEDITPETIMLEHREDFACIMIKRYGEEKFIQDSGIDDAMDTEEIYDRGLLPHQQMQLPAYVDKWILIGLSTEPANRPQAEKGIRQVYQSENSKLPEQIIWYESPFAMYLSDHVSDSSNILRNRWSVDHYGRFPVRPDIHRVVEGTTWKQINDIIWETICHPLYSTIRIEARQRGKSVNWNPSYGQHAVYKLMVYDFYRHVLQLHTEVEPHLGWEVVGKNAGWWLPLQNVCLISERHTTLNLDDQHRLHCEDGLAIGYPDGWGIYAWHGVQVPDYVIVGDITPDKIISEPNAEVSRIMIERYGQDRFIRDGGFSIVQSDDYGELYRVEFDNGDEPIVAVHVQDTSTDRDYFLYVPPHIRTAHEGVAWTFGYDNVSDYNPDKQT